MNLPFHYYLLSEPVFHLYDFIQQLGGENTENLIKKMKLLYNILSLYPAFWGHASVFFMMFKLKMKKMCTYRSMGFMYYNWDKFNLASIETCLSGSDSNKIVQNKITTSQGLPFEY